MTRTMKRAQRRAVFATKEWGRPTCKWGKRFSSKKRRTYGKLLCKELR